MTEQTNIATFAPRKAQPRLCWEAYKANCAANAAMDGFCRNDKEEDEALFNAQYAVLCDAIDKAIFTPADNPSCIARKLENYHAEEMENWRTGEAAFAMIRADAKYFDDHGWQPD